MKIVFSICLLIFLPQMCLQAQDSLQVDLPARSSPLEAYLSELDEMGRLLSGWNGEKLEMGSWFFGSYAMLVLRNNGHSDLKPFPGLEAAIPALWGDFKNLTPRYLVEFAGGSLSYGKLMSVAQNRPFDTLLAEEQFILHVAGLAYLRMLNGTVGDSLFSEILYSTIDSTQKSFMITDKLIESVEEHCSPTLSLQYSKALSTGSWMDVEIQKVEKNSDSFDIYIEQNGIWGFPVDVLLISKSGDSTYSSYALEQRAPLRVEILELDRIILDPDHKLAEYYRYNNKWPRLNGNIRFQPFVALPDWEYYRFTLNPSSWSDWDGDRRYGLKITTGFGIDLWPAYPSDYRHRVTLEMNSHKPYDSEGSWGGRVSYGNPLNIQKRLFGSVKIHGYDDWSGLSLGITKYVGEQVFLIQGPKLKYQRIAAEIEHDSYNDSLIWKQESEINVLKISYSGLALTRYGYRLYVNLRAAAGARQTDSFSVLKAQVDLSGVFWGWLAGGMQFVGGTQDRSIPDPYQFTHDYAWQDNLSALPNFRGQTRIAHQTNNYLGLSLSAGYWLPWSQLKLFASSMIYDQDGLKLALVKPHHAAGFGIEHKSFFTAGLYFPIWQSHPIEGENPWAWRYQWRLTWNL
ncbi:hypothetical protein HQ531_04030 [bacterium]|nr:hypothetical protein [bacterium]